MVPGDIYEAAKLDGVHPVRTFFKITLPLIKAPLMVAIIFRALDSLRIFDLIYVLTPGTETTKTMSVYAQEYLFAFDRFAEGSAASTMPMIRSFCSSGVMPSQLRREATSTSGAMTCRVRL